MRKPILIAALALLAAAPAPHARAALPACTKTTLRNGLTVYIMPTRRLPLVDFRLVAAAGAVRDPEGKEGLANLTAELLTQGAGDRSATRIAGDIAFIGGSLEATAGAEQLVVTCEVLARDFDQGLAMFRDVIVDPTFPAEEFERKRSETLGALAAVRDDPASIADSELPAFIFEKTPLGHPAMGWESSVEGLTRDDVVRFHAENVTPDNALLAIVGDVDPEATLKAVRKAFGKWKKGRGGRAGAYTAPGRDTARSVRVITKPEVTQTQIRMACVGVPRDHPDYEPIIVANTILGAGFTSRLVDEIRVNKGLTYSIRSRFTMHRRTGAFGVSTFTRNETLRETIDATIAVIEKLRREGPTEEELAKAKNYLTGLYPLGLQAPDNLAARLLDVAFYGLPDDTIEKYGERVRAVTMEDCRRALKSYFCTDELDILVVSNPDVARPALEGLGPIEVRPPR